MAYQMAATAVILNDLEGHSPVAGLFKCNPSNICAAFYTISIDNVLARPLCISRASCPFIYTSMYVIVCTRAPTVSLPHIIKLISTLIRVVR